MMKDQDNPQYLISQAVLMVKKLRNRLTAISGAAQVLDMQVDEKKKISPEDIKELLSIILSECENIEKEVGTYLEKVELTTDEIPELAHEEIDPTATQLRFRTRKKRGGIRVVD